MSADILTPGKAGSPGSAETFLALVSRRRWRGVRAGARREYSRKCSLWDVAVGSLENQVCVCFGLWSGMRGPRCLWLARVVGGAGSVGERKQVGAREGLSVGAVALESVLKDCGGQ